MQNDLKIIVRIKNNLILSKAKELWGNDVTQGFIAEKTGISNDLMCRYLNFKVSPIHRKRNEETETWKESAKMIATVLSCEPEDIFPEAFKEIKKNEYSFELSSEYFTKQIESSPEDGIRLLEIKQAVRKALTTLTEREQIVIRRRFGIDQDKSETLEEISRDWSLSKERIREIEWKALMKLKRPCTTRLFD